MIEIANLKTLFDVGVTIIKEMKSQNVVDEDKYDLALLSLYAATTETKNYISSITNVKKHDKEKELQLSELWNKAGVNLRRINNNLAYRCIVKADYWSNPNEWTDDDINESNISLNKIIQESIDLMTKR